MKRFKVVLTGMLATVMTMIVATGAAAQTALDQGLRAYAERDFQTAETNFRAAIGSGADVAKAHLMLGRTLVYLGRLPEAKQEVLTARATGLADDDQADAELTLRYIAEAMAEVAAVPSKAVFEATGYLRGELIDGLARDASLSSDLTPRRKSDWRRRIGGGLGVETPILSGASSLSLGVGIDELRYDTYRDFDEGNYRGSARLHHRLSETWAASLEYDALRTFVGYHDPYSLTNRIGVGTTFRQGMLPEIGAAMIGQIGTDWVVTDYDTVQDLDSEAKSFTLGEQARFTPTDWIGLSFTYADSAAEQLRYSYRLSRLMLTAQGSLERFGLGEALDDISIRGALGLTELQFAASDSIQTDRRRQDRIRSISLGATKPITPWLAVVLDTSYSHTNSTLTRYDYHSTLVSLGLRVGF